MRAMRSRLAVFSASLLIVCGSAKKASADQPRPPGVASPASPVDPCKDPSPLTILAATDVRGKGSPTTSHPFFAATPLDVCIAVTSGGKPRGDGRAAASAVVSLDGSVLLSERDFSPKFVGGKVQR